MSKVNEALSSLNKGVNPATRRKFGNGRVGKVLTSLKVELRKDQDTSRFWNTKECPTGALIDGKCYSSQQDVDTTVRFLKHFKGAKQTNALPEKARRETEERQRKKEIAAKKIQTIKAQKDSALKQMSQTKQDIKNQKKLLMNTEVIAYTRKKNLNAAKNTIKKLELEKQKLKNQLTMASEQRYSLM